MHVSISNFVAIFNKLQACATTSTEHFLGSSRKNFSFLIFLQDFFWAATLQIRSETFGTKFTKTNTRSGFLSKNHPISKKKNGSNRSSDVGDIADLKSAILSEFL
jgi:hypothetical protein